MPLPQVRMQHICYECRKQAKCVNYEVTPTQAEFVLGHRILWLCLVCASKLGFEVPE